MYSTLIATFTLINNCICYITKFTITASLVINSLLLSEKFWPRLSEMTLGKINTSELKQVTEFSDRKRRLLPSGVTVEARFCSALSSVYISVPVKFTLTDRLGSQPNLSVKWSVTIGTMTDTGKETVCVNRHLVTNRHHTRFLHLLHILREINSFPSTSDKFRACALLT